MPHERLVVRSHKGLGDGIYMRAVVRELVREHDVYLDTPWPQLVSDMPIKCIRTLTSLRTQKKNADAVRMRWHMAPPGAPSKRISYTGKPGSMLHAMFESIGMQPSRVTFDLPTFVYKGSTVGRSEHPLPYIVIRPATLRSEFPASARNPLPEYLALAAEKLRKHFRIVSIADLQPRHEWTLQPLPYADETYHAGELGLEQLMSLVAGAAGVVAGVGWAAPAAVAYRVPLFMIYGGSGLYDGPDRVFDPRMPNELVHHAIPDNFCRACSNRAHACDKRIRDIDRQVEAWVVELTTRASTAVAA